MAALMAAQTAMSFTAAQDLGSKEFQAGHEAIPAARLGLSVGILHRYSNHIIMVSHMCGMQVFLRAGDARHGVAEGTALVYAASWWNAEAAGKYLEDQV